MKIVVLAGGTSTERTVSITSGTGICKALRQKGHQAILVDIFCGIENVDRENPFPSEYDVDAASEYMSAFNDRIEQMKKERRSFFGPNVLKLCEAADLGVDAYKQIMRTKVRRLTLFSWDFMVRTEKTEKYRQHLT